MLGSALRPLFLRLLLRLCHSSDRDTRSRPSQMRVSSFESTFTLDFMISNTCIEYIAFPAKRKGNRFPRLPLPSDYV